MFVLEVRAHKTRLIVVFVLVPAAFADRWFRLFGLSTFLVDGRGGVSLVDLGFLLLAAVVVVLLSLVAGSFELVGVG